MEIDLARYPKQDQFVNDRARYVVWVGGRGSAKTASGTFKVMDYVSDPKHAGCRGVIIAPQYKMMNSGTYQTFCEWFPREWIVSMNRQDWEMNLVNGCKIFFRNTLNPDNLRSLDIAWAWLDEAAMLRGDVLDILRGGHRQSGYPLQTWITTTPRGFNWISKSFIDAETRLKNVSVYHSDLRDNPWLSKEYIADMMQLKGKFFEQEVEGRFVTWEGLVYGMFSPARHVKKVGEMPTSFEYVVGGVDFGASAPTAAYLIGVDKSNRRWIFREFYQRRAKIGDLLAQLAEWQRDFKVRAYYCDPANNTEIALLRASGISARKANNKILSGVRFVSQLFSDDALFVSEECLWGLSEVQTYCFKSKVSDTLQEDTGDSRYQGEEKFADKIVKQNDHAMDAWRYGLMGAAQQAQPHGIVAFKWG